MKWLPSFLVSLQDFVSIKRALGDIMATLQELSDKADQLQATVDAEQEQIRAAIASLEQTIADLQAQIAAGSGPTPEQLQAVVDKLEATRVDLAGTIPDA